MATIGTGWEDDAVTSELKLYDELAHWFHLITAPADYEEEAALYSTLIEREAERQVATVLEMGSGGGNNASHMKRQFEMTLTDLSQAMLDLSATINPECEHIQGDMRTMRLGRRFDAVFVHDAVMYLTNASDLQAAMNTAVAHCAPGGVVVFAPDAVTDTYHPYETSGGHDGPDGRRARYRDRTGPPEPDGTVVTEFVVDLYDVDGSHQQVVENHRFGLFSKHDWISMLERAGCQTVIAEPVSLGEKGFPTSFVFVGLVTDPD